MSRRPVLVDTNVIVAALSATDPLRERAKAALASRDGQLVTCWPVLVEAAYLLRRSRGAIAALVRACSDPSILALLDIGPSELPKVLVWMSDYADQQPDLADACLVYLAGRESIDEILTFDRDFEVYRTPHGRAFNVLGKA